MSMKQVIKIIGVFLLSTCILTASNFNVYISKSQLNEEGGNDLAEAVKASDVDALKSMLKSPIQITLDNNKKVTLTLNSLTLAYKGTEDQKEYVTVNVTKDAENKLIVNKKALAGALKFTVGFKGKYDTETEEKDYSTVLLTTENLKITQTFGKPAEAYSQIVAVEINDNLIPTVNTCPDVLKDKCSAIMDSVANEYSPLMNTNLKGSLKKGIAANQPFGTKTASDALASNLTGVDKKIVFNLSETKNPIYNDTGDSQGLIRFYDGNSKLTTEEKYVDIASTSEFTNFLLIEGDYQYALSQAAVNKAYSLLIDNTEQKDVLIVDKTFEGIIDFFPDLAQDYARDDTFTLNIQTTNFNTETKRFDGKLTVKLPSVGTQAARDIVISYAYYVDNVFAHAESTDAKPFEITLVNVFSYVGDISIAGDCGIVYEDRLRTWLSSSLKQIHDQEPMKNAFKAGTSFTALFPELYKNSSFQNGSYIFVRKSSSAVITPTLLFKSTKFLDESN